MKVIRKRLDAIQIRTPYTRWSDVCECVEITFDNGETWIPSPENDPREGIGFRAPPRTGASVKCLAAINMVAVIKEQVDAALVAATAVGIATAIIGIITALVPGINLLVNLFVAIAGALVTIGSAAIDAAFTPETYDGLECIFFNNIGEDGQVSSAQIVEIQNDVNAEYGGVVFEVFALLVLGMGSNGFSNAGSLGEITTGNCDDCDDVWCYSWMQTLPYDPAWTITAGSYNAIDNRMDGVNSDPVSGNTMSLAAQISFAATEITFMGVYLEYKSQGTYGGNSLQSGIGTTPYSNVQAIVSPTPTFNESASEFSFTISPTTTTGLWFGFGIPSAGSLDTYARAIYITVRGNGTCPFGDENC